jgi:RND family efflux transporter MFP subunit
MNAHWKKTGLALLAGSCLLAGCAKSPQTAQETAAVVPVSLARAAPRDLPETLRLPGRVMPREQTSVVATAAGQVQSVLVGVGDAVKKGQLLATLEAGGSQTTLNEAKQALNGLETQLRRLQTASLGGDGDSLTPAGAAQRISQLEQEAQSKLTALFTSLQTPGPQTLPELVRIGRQIQQAQSQVSLLQAQALIGKSLEVFRAPLLQTLQAQLVQAHQAVRLAEAQLQAARITAPFDGVILGKNAVAGTPSGPGVPLFSVGSVADVDFEVLVDPALQARLKPGQTAQVQIGDHAPVTVPLASVSPSLDLQAKSFTAHATLDNEQGSYKPGEVGQALITLDPHTGALTVPTAAILHDAQGSYVLQVQGDTAVKKPITTGYNNGTYTEVLTGLKADEDVIHEGLDRVQPGTKVRVAASETRG